MTIYTIMINQNRYSIFDRTVEENGLKRTTGILKKGLITFSPCLLYTSEECDEYYCDVNLDEDEYYRFVSSYYKECPYYRSGDEYKVVRHQM